MVEKILRKWGFDSTGSGSLILQGFRIISIETWITWKSLNPLCKNRKFLSRADFRVHYVNDAAFMFKLQSVVIALYRPALLLNKKRT